MDPAWSLGWGLPQAGDVPVYPTCPGAAAAYSDGVGPRIKTIVTVGGVGEKAARALAPALLRGVRREPRVTEAEVQWDPAASRLLVTVVAETDAEATDADEAENLHRVWRSAVRCVQGTPQTLEFDIEGSIGLLADE